MKSMLDGTVIVRDHNVKCITSAANPLNFDPKDGVRDLEVVHGVDAFHAKRTIVYEASERMEILKAKVDAYLKNGLLSVGNAFSAKVTSDILAECNAKFQAHRYLRVAIYNKVGQCSLHS
jgi:hypothetical protein